MGRKSSYVGLCLLPLSSFITSSVSPGVLEVELFDEEQSGHPDYADICSFEIVARFIYLSLAIFIIFKVQ